MLCIIALVAAGVTAGLHMIKEAEIQKFIKQYSTFNTEVNAFREKYEYLPGDLPAGKAAALGFYSAPGGAFGGNGNGMVEIYGTSWTNSSEGVIFWRHLGDAGLLPNIPFCSTCPVTITGTFITPSAAMDVSTADAATLSSINPTAPVGSGNYWYVFSKGTTSTSAAGNGSYFQVIGLTQYQDGTGGTNPPGTWGLMTAAHQAGFTPLQAYSIDAKIDDGKPQSGIVQAMQGGATRTSTMSLGTAATTGTANQSVCVFTGGASYNTGGTAANALNCELRLDMAQ